MLCGSAAMAGAQRQTTDAGPVAFDALFVRIASVTLVADPVEPLGVPLGIVVIGDEVIIVDRSNLNLKVFDRRTGAHVRTIGRKGRGPGEFRGISAIDSDAAGHLYTIDRSRRILGIRDVSGKVLSETHVNGSWTGMNVVVSGGRTRTMLTGRNSITTRVDFDQPAALNILHELDGDSLVRSFDPVPIPVSQWKGIFGDFFSAAMGPVIVSGSYGSQSVYVRNVETGIGTTHALAAPWLKPLAWPKDDTYGAGTLSDQLNRWAKEQTMLSELIGSDAGYFIACVRMFSANGEEEWGYIVGDATGAMTAVSTATPVRLAGAQGDTVFALIADDVGDYTLESRVLRNHR